MTDLATRGEALTKGQARTLTQEVKADAERLWFKMLRLYEGEAHMALGYSSWGDYFTVEFGGSKSSGYRILEAARVVEAIPGAGNGRPNLEQAGALVPLLDQPDQLHEAWDEARADGTPTAVKVREAVERRLPPVTPEAREKQLRWVATMNVLDGLDHFDRPAVAEQAEAEAALIDQAAAATRRQTVTPERLRSASAWTALLADALERTPA